MLNLIKVWLFVIIFTIQIQTIQAQCSGYVANYNLHSRSIFNGECSETGSLLWGKEDYLIGENNGDSFYGFYTSGLRDIGQYNYRNGSYARGKNYLESTPPSKNGYNYNFFGTLYFPERNTNILGFFEDLSSNGFVISKVDPTDSDERVSEAGIMVKGLLNGYGKRTYKNGQSYYAYFENNAAIGDYYQDNTEGTYKYNRTKNGVTTGPFILSNSDLSRLERIKDFIYKNVEFINKEWAEVQLSFDSYNSNLKSYNKWVASIERNPSSTKNANPGSSSLRTYDANLDLIKSIQELLQQLDYSPGIPDGIMGARTTAAIKAFQYFMDFDPDGIANEELLILLQLAYKTNLSVSISDGDTVLVSTGTGFYINKNNVVTNNHVISGCEYLSDENENKLSLLIQDEVNDLAILEGASSEAYLNIYKESPNLGEKIYVAGFPYNSDLKGFNFTSGNVSSLMGLGRDVVNFQITAPVQPGNSGGAVINEYGGVIGVTASRINDEYILEKTETLPQNINFAIKNTILKDMLSENQINYKTNNPFFRVSQQKIAQSSKESSILIKCFGLLNEE